MPVSLETLDLSGGYGAAEHKFTGGIPAEWCSMTNLKELKMARCGLDGESACAGMPRRSEVTSRLCELCAGELPLALIRMKAKGCNVSLGGNKGFTLPCNIGELGDDITKLDLSTCSLQGKFSSS